MRSPLLFSIVLLALSAGCAKKLPEFTPGAMNEETVRAAAESAGFRVVSLGADIPAAVRPLFPFHFFGYGDSLLSEIRDRYELEKVVADGGDEWERQCLLKRWIHGRIINGTPTEPGEDAIQILENSTLGFKYWCSYYALTWMQCAQALGWSARKLGIDRLHGPEGHESAHHGVSEVWSNQFGKWIVIDCQSDLHYEKDGVPLSAWEVRSEWLRNGGADVDRVVGVPHGRDLKNPAIVWWDREDEDETAVYFWIYYSDNARDWNEEPPGRFIFPQDSANAGLIWYQNGPDNKGRLHTGYQKKLFLPSGDPAAFNWTVGVVEAFVGSASPKGVNLELDSFCPNRTGYEISLDGADWSGFEGSAVSWPLHEGVNRLALRTVNAAGVRGPAMWIMLELTRD